MAQTKRKRRSKHRGNAAGSVEARGRTSRPPVDAKGRPAARAGAAKGDARGRAPIKPATLQRAAIKAAGFAVLLFVLMQIGVFGKNHTPLSGLVLAAFSFLLYTPLVFMTDRWAYTRDQRRRAGTLGGKRR